ncbi:MAG: hypothetical protein QY302_02370 [Anaerolineales bacterium]|nr:MAG: hypothetical protein QY302_02370 [Anaerolineales bacterium]
MALQRHEAIFLIEVGIASSGYALLAMTDRFGNFDDSVFTSFLQTKPSFAGQPAQQKSPSQLHRAFVRSVSKQFPDL